MILRGELEMTDYLNQVLDLMDDKFILEAAKYNKDDVATEQKDSATQNIAKEQKEKCRDIH